MYRRFVSIQHPDKFGYTYESDAYDSHAQVDYHFRMFETYGDGTIQHSRDWSITREFMADYLGSIAQAMLAPRSEGDMWDAELIESLVYTFAATTGDRAINFAASVVYKESDGSYTKRRYYSMQDQKISSSHSKEHDKRYEAIQDWMDGSGEAIYRLLIGDFPRALDCYRLADALYDWYAKDSDKRPWCRPAADFLDWPEYQDEKANHLRQAFDACQSICKAYQAYRHAKATLERYVTEVTPREAEKEMAS
jgi:hypothetical protein